MLDTWHFHRTGGDPAALAALRPGELGGLQVSDAPAPADDMAVSGTRRRELPGQGVMALRDVLAVALAAARTDRPPFVGAEVLNDDLPALAPAEAAAQAAASLRSVL
jgi:sugar phosphate isomerase/epimerase